MERFELGPEPRTIEELRRLEARMPPWSEQPRPGRAESRSPVNLSIQVAWETSNGRRHVAPARAREVAATSVYFEIGAGARISSPDLLLELEPGRRLSLCAVVRVARVEEKEGKIGIAVVLEDYCFEALPGPRLVVLRGPSSAADSSPKGATMMPRQWGCPETV